MHPIIKLNDKIISQESSCFVIAEIGHNHQGSLETARKMIREAALSGADCVKLQKRNNKKLYTTDMYNKPYENENSFGNTYGEHRDALEFGEYEYSELKAYSEKLGLVFISTAFDLESVDFLERIDIPAYKIASGDITNHPLIEYIARKKKPVFISTGGANIQQVREAYGVLKKHTDAICIMQCTAAYPAEPQDLNLNVIPAYLTEFPGAIIGYSGHDNGIIMPVIAYVLGARVVEKHFTLNRAMKGTDHKFSHEPTGLRKMVRDLNRARQALGSAEKKQLSCESSAVQKMGKSLFFSRDVQSGEIISQDMICLKSPGEGIPPSELPQVIGKKITMDLPIETQLSFEHFQ